ncbi:MAG: HlyC/CorC family transporter [Alphaproteobacteria bacterium]|nr:HlyC/CorC family transporter [Alphaproteobacteria bacterium]
MEDVVLLTLGAILILLILSAFFSGSETALTAASRLRLYQLERGGNNRARIVNQLRERKERLIGAILLGNNLVNILASAMATSLLIGWFGETGVIYATLVMTALVLIFSEVLPKTYAIHNATRTALWVAPVLRWVVRAFAPVTHAIQWIVAGTLRIFGVRIIADRSLATMTEELLGAIEMRGGKGATPRQERAMLRSILDLASVTVSEILIHRKSVFMVNADEPPAEILTQVLSSNHTRFPLWQDTQDNIVGVLHAKAMLRAVHEHKGDLEGLNPAEIASPPWFIPESTTLLSQLQAFRQRHEHMALVVDEYGALLGIVTLEDILEEIVGEISDEHDVTISGIWPQPDGSVVARGTTTLRDLNREFDWRLPDEPAATVAGLLLHEARQIPDVGQTFEFHGFRFEILRRYRNQVTSVHIVPLAPPARKEKASA